MNILFMTQGATLDLFNDLVPHLKKINKINKVGFCIADSGHYGEYIKTNNDFELTENYKIIKEWELFNASLDSKIDYDIITKYEKKLNVPNFWNAILADRRIVHGRNFTYNQDYNTEFNHEDILKFLTVFLPKLDVYLDKLNPSFVLSFICTTMSEYLVFLFCQHKKIPFYNLRPTRIKNFFHAADSVYEPSELIKKSFDEYNMNGLNDEWLTYAEKHLKEIRMNSAKYEGVVLPSSPPPYSSYLPSLKKPLVKIINLFKDEISYRTSNYIPDRHTPGRLIPIYHAQIKNPLKIKKIKRKISKKYINTEKLEEIKFAFFPLHIEPEVTLLVYSPYYLNQIEVIRNIAYSLPTEMKLVVKEHPAAIGKRPYTFYKKILNIPNVLLANPNDDPRMYIENSKLITTIAGSVGLEGAFLGKPVITFGKTPYEIISNNMVIKIKDINTLSAQIRRILFDYKLDDELLIRYIASVMKNSTPINFYSKLLNRKNTYLIDSGESREDDLIRLSKYIIKIYKGY